MKVLSLFDGMSCGRIALDQLNIPVEKYYASEIDKYAMQVSQANYPEIIQVGDICNLDAKDYQDVDLMLAGSPCQGFSMAGKQLAFDDPRSALFFEFIRLLKEIKPKYFLLENVRMKKEYLQVISEQVSACYPEIPFGIEPIFINSSLLSAQSRPRYYWTNIPGIQEPKEKGIVLKDILETREIEGVIAGAYRARSIDKDGNRVAWKEAKPQQMLELRKDNKSNSVTSVQKDSVLTKDEVYWRKLTPLECERLQTVPDNYTNHVSNSQRFKMLGNGWTIAVIKHIFKNMEIR